MKRIIFICLTSTFFCKTIFAKSLKSKDSDTVEVCTIIYDYSTQSFENNKILASLRVKDWVNIQIKNLPKSAVISSSLTYTNRHLEDRTTFGNVMNFNNTAQLNKTDSSQPASMKRLLETFDSSIDCKTNLEIYKYYFQLSQTDSLITDEKMNKLPFFESAIINEERQFQIGKKNIAEPLDVLIAKQFIAAQINNRNSSSEKITNERRPLGGIEWQTCFMKNLEDKVNEKLAFRDTIIYQLSAKVKDSMIHNLALVQIENYDFTEFQINITDTTKSTTIGVIRLPFRNRKGFKIDFSTGLALSGLGNKSYSIVESDRSAFVQIKEDDEKFSRLSMGISLLAHAYCRNAEFVNFGITSGLTVNISNQSLNYVLGGSLLLGEDQRFILSAGAILGKTEQLKSYYKTNTDISADKLLLNQPVPVIQKFSPSVFLGVSYNLGISSASKTIQL